MPKLVYRIGYIDLTLSVESIFSRIFCRTEIRRAQKEGISVRVFSGSERPKELIEACQSMLKNLLRLEYVPYDKSFDHLLMSTENFCFVAYTIDGVPVSFITVEQKSNSEAFSGKRAAFLSLSATNKEYRGLCPNYLLIWQAIEMLKEKEYEFFNLGLLSYEHCPEPALERVAFFKRKWHCNEYPQEVSVSFFMYIYYRFFKRYSFLKALLFYIRRMKHFLFFFR